MAREMRERVSTFYVSQPESGESVTTGDVESVSKIEAKYVSRTPNSRAMDERAQRVMPGGETRSTVYFPPYGVTLDHGKGPRIWDIDGNEYLDLANNYTCLVHGHAFPPIVEAVQAQAAKGSTWASKAEKQVELAELIVERVEAVDQVRFANSGTEAVLNAIGIARAHTGRQKILFSTYSYHGFLLETSTPENIWLDHYLGEWGDAASFERILDEHGDEIAAVMLEPILGLGGTVSAPVEFFERVKAAAHKAGALFIFDEATVFRVAIGGAQKLLGVNPDLSVLGKYVGGGYPAGSLGGTAEVMSTINPRTGNFHLSGTFSGNPITMAAGVEAVKHYTEAHTEKMAEQMAAIEETLKASAAKRGLPFSSQRIRGLMNIYFQDALPKVAHLRQDDRLASLFQLACLVNGVFVVSRLVMNTATTMDDASFAELLQRLDAAMADVAAEA